MCWQTVFRFCIPLKVTFSNSIALKDINKSDKRSAVHISTVFRPVDHVACTRVL